jgi:hypothetical protein
MRLTEPAPRRPRATRLRRDDPDAQREFPELGLRGPQPGAPANVTIHLHVDDCDEVIDPPSAPGRPLEMPRADHFYGSAPARSAAHSDTGGTSATTLKRWTPDQMQHRYDETARPS